MCDTGTCVHDARTQAPFASTTRTQERRHTTQRRKQRAREGMDEGDGAQPVPEQEARTHEARTTSPSDSLGSPTWRMIFRNIPCARTQQDDPPCHTSPHAVLGDPVRTGCTCTRAKKRTEKQACQARGAKHIMPHQQDTTSVHLHSHEGQHTALDPHAPPTYL